jgi:hypothetical protein
VYYPIPLSQFPRDAAALAALAAQNEGVPYEVEFT